MSLYDDYKKDSTETTDIHLKEEIYDIVKQPIYKRKEFYILLSTVLAIVTVLSLLIYTPKFKMENLLGKNEQYAKTYSENYKLRLSVTKEFNDEYSRDQIFEQSLKAGTKYKEGRVLEVKISKGPDYEKKLQYPSFNEMTFEEAEAWKKDNFAKGLTIKQEYSDSYETGAFISEDLAEDKKKDLTRSTQFTVVYSKGQAADNGYVKMEDFSGKTTADVALWAYKNEVEFEVVEIFDDYLTPGAVLEQSVKAGEEIEKGTSFNITVCVGPGVLVPNFYGLSKEKAANTASSAGVQVMTTSVYSGSVKSGSLISQSVSSGVRIKETDSVELVYSLGKVPINNFTGSSYIDVVTAVNELNEMGANIKISVAYVNRTEGAISGNVASNSYASSFVNPGTTITVNVYR